MDLAGHPNLRFSSKGALPQRTAHTRKGSSYIPRCPPGGLYAKRLAQVSETELLEGVSVTRASTSKCTRSAVCADTLGA